MDNPKSQDPMVVVEALESTTQVLAAKLERVVERLDQVVALLDEIRSQN